MFSLIKNNLKDQKLSLPLVIDTIKKQGVLALLKKSYRFSKRTTFLLLPLNLRLSFAKKLEKFESNNVDEVINCCFNVLGGLIKPVQIREEFEEFLTLFQDKRPKIILEIGTDRGGSLFALCKLAPDDAMVISLDLPANDTLGGYPEWKESLYMMFKKPKQQLLLLRGDSHSQKMLDQMNEVLGTKKIDFIFLDGDHSYEGVKKDFEMYSPLVKKGGVIAFHDVATNEAETGVPKFWEETKKSYEYVEFIRDKQQVGYGIGCLFI
jgi:predicted O-methyltransferase YrrM